MEIRIGKMTITKPGGNSSKNAKTYRANIPTSWAKHLKITDEDRIIKMSFDGNKIIIEKFKE